MLATPVPTAFQNVEKADQVGVGVGARIIERMAYTRLCGEVDHVHKPLRRKQSRDAIAVCNIHLLEPEAGKCLERFYARCFQARIVI